MKSDMVKARVYRDERKAYERLARKRTRGNLSELIREVMNAEVRKAENGGDKK